MKWIDLFNFLNKQASNIDNIGKFDWQSNIVVFDKDTAEYYDANLLEFNDAAHNDIYLTIDTNKFGEDD